MIGTVSVVALTRSPGQTLWDPALPDLVRLKADPTHLVRDRAIAPRRDQILSGVWETDAAAPGAAAMARGRPEAGRTKAGPRDPRADAVKSFTRLAARTNGSAWDVAASAMEGVSHPCRTGCDAPSPACVSGRRLARSHVENGAEQGSRMSTIRQSADAFANIAVGREEQDEGQ